MAANRKGNMAAYNGKPWAPEAIRYLRQGYGLMTIEEMAYRLGRTKEGVRMKARRLGITKTPQAAGIRLIAIDLRCNWCKASLKGRTFDIHRKSWLRQWKLFHRNCGKWAKR